MFDQLVQTFQSTLRTRWSDRLPALLARAKNFSSTAMLRLRTSTEETRDAEVERVVREAYMTGYQQAYMDGILDFIESASGDAPPNNLFESVH